MPRRILSVTTLLIALACERAPRPAASASPATTSAIPRAFPVKGQVRSLEIAERQVVLAHEQIPGYMDAMTMPFRVRDEATFNMLRPGDVVEATLIVSQESEYLEDVVVKQKGKAPAPGAPSVGPKRGDRVPDVTLRDQDGRPLTTASLRGKAVALTFIFTRCPLPEFCPRMGKSFAAVERWLAADAPLQGETRLVSISFDTAFDTPEVLKKWGRTYQPGADAFSHWRIAGGSLVEVKKIATFFGLEFQEETGQFTHNLRTAVVTRDGMVFKVYRGNDWRPEELVADLKEAAKAPSRPATRR